jgi:hypothetical protein
MKATQTKEAEMSGTRSSRDGIITGGMFTGKPEVKELLCRSRHRCELRIKL